VSAGLTIVIPYWDLDPEYLLEAVGSITAGQGGPYRTIVVDNASSVPPPELPPSVEIVRLPERVHVGEARNAGLALVETSHVLFLDADDVISPGSVPLLLQQLERRPDAVVSCGSGRIVPPPIRALGGEETRTWRRRRLRRRRRRLLNVYRLQRWPRLLAVVNTVEMIVSMSCTVMRVDAVRAAGGFSADLAEEDWVLSALLPFHGPVVAGRFPVRGYRLRAGSLTVQKGADWSVASRARRQMRRRLRRDPAVPLPVRWATPLLAALHGMPELRRLQARLGPRAPA
jgi:glycosyltransferase involved in cell wall biosynthesis